MSKLTAPGLYADGGGLYLQIRPPSAKSWVFRYQMDGKARMMGLGGVDAVSLSDARTLALECRNLKARGIDPKAHRDAERASKAAKAAKRMTFKECAETYIKAHRGGWKNAKHQAQWTATLETYAFPKIGKLDVADIGTGHVHSVLEPIWQEKPETASRLRGRIERILGYATTAGYREGDNPARWRGHLQNLLAPRAKLKAVKHHAALPYSELPIFMAKLRKQEGVSAAGLEFAILTAARTGEVINATWDEVDLAGHCWTIPGDRMKAGKEHRVPLSSRAVQLLEEMAKLRSSRFVFPSTKEGRGLSSNAFRALLIRMERADLTAHGFRSTFRDWTAEQTAYPRDVCEMALAHTIPNAVEAAYRRGDLYAKRARLMEEWAGYCAQEKADTAEVTPIRA